MRSGTSSAAAAVLAAGLAAIGCAPYARPLESPWRASVAAFYTEAPKADANPSARVDVALDRWLDDRFLLGVDASHASFERARGRSTTAVGVGARLAYVLDLSEVQPRFGVRAAAERWVASEDARVFTPLFVTAFGALDWAPRAWPFTIGGEVLSPPLAATTTAAGIPGFAYGVRSSYVF
jgi:hypothetical protein